MKIHELDTRRESYKEIGATRPNYLFIVSWLRGSRKGNSRVNLAAVAAHASLLACLFTSISTAYAANYPLELVSPRAVGTAPSSIAESITTQNRIFKAYPGIEYNIRAVVVGGEFPYVFSLSGAPGGMTINRGTGEIVWPNPTGTTVTPTISVTDAEGTVRSASWTITVTTSGFRFVDSVNGSAYPAGAGTRDNPWRGLADIVNSPDAVAGDVVYFRSGTYAPTGLTRASIGSVWERVEFSSAKPNIWIAYPGETPVIDFGFRVGVDAGVLFRLPTTNLYVDGLEATNARVIGFQTGDGAYGVFRRVRMHDLNMINAELDGSNAAFIMTLSSYSDADVGGNISGWSQHLAIQDSEFFGSPNNVAIKIYSQWKLLIEDNYFHDSLGGVELKADIPQFTYRHNVHERIPGISIGGNMHSYTTHGEVLFNLVKPVGQYALDLNQDGYAKRVDIYRNTFLGRVRLRNTDAADGPFAFYNNVIVNDDSGSHITMESVDPSRATVSNNLVGTASDGIVDANGRLLGTYVSFTGTRGYEIGVAPVAPLNLTAH
jgi:hypothetical protein